jgi:hypothetical protein
MRLTRSLAITFALCLVVAACGSSPGPTTTPPPSPSVAPSPTETVAPTPSGPASPPPVDSVPIPPDTYARVVTDDLRVRSKPGVSDDSEKLEPLLQDGALLVVLDGPVQASGYDWYLVQPTISFESESVAPFGWVAAADKDGEAWIEPAAVECPALPATVADLAAVNETDQQFYEVTCFGGREISFRARLASPEAACGIDVPWGTDPIWFDSCYRDATYLVPVDDPGAGVPFFPTWAPDVDLGIAPDPQAQPEDWPIVEVTGLYDHPAAQTCRNRVNYEEPASREPDPAHTVFECRIQFVVTSLREVAG